MASACALQLQPRRESGEIEAGSAIHEQCCTAPLLPGRSDDCLRVDAAQIAPEQIACARLLHIDGHDTPAVAHAASVARRCGIPVTVDVDTIYHGFDKVLPNVDYLVASSEFPAGWTGI